MLLNSEKDIHISPSSDHLFSFAAGHFDYSRRRRTRRSRPSYKHLYNMCLKSERRRCFEMVNLEIFFPVQVSLLLEDENLHSTLPKQDFEFLFCLLLGLMISFRRFHLKSGQSIYQNQLDSIFPKLQLVRQHLSFLQFCGRGGKHSFFETIEPPLSFHLCWETHRCSVSDVLPSGSRKKTT